MAVRNPHIMSRSEHEPSPTHLSFVVGGNWFEIKLDEFTVQKHLPCFLDNKNEFWVDPQDWDEWQCELVEYFISNNYKGPEIDAFIKSHALGGTGKVDRS